MKDGIRQRKWAPSLVPPALNELLLSYLHIISLFLHKVLLVSFCHSNIFGLPKYSIFSGRRRLSLSDSTKMGGWAPTPPCSPPQNANVVIELVELHGLDMKINCDEYEDNKCHIFLRNCFERLFCPPPPTAASVRNPENLEKLWLNRDHPALWFPSSSHMTAMKWPHWFDLL